MGTHFSGFLFGGQLVALVLVLALGIGRVAAEHLAIHGGLGGQQLAAGQASGRQSYHEVWGQRLGTGQ